MIPTASTASRTTPAALVRPDTLARAEAAELDAKTMLANNDAYGFFSALGDLVVTGPTRTNVKGTVTFTDDDGGINSAQFNVVQASCRSDNPDCFPSFGFDPGVTDIKGVGQFTFQMWCEGPINWTTEVTLRDEQGRVSNPWMFAVTCNPLLALARPGPMTRAVSLRTGGGGP